MTSTSIYSTSIPVAQSKTDIFISKAKAIHGELYNYDLVEYTNAHTKIKIRCKIHGIFEQTPNGHLVGKGCPICGKNKQILSKTSNNDDFIKKAIIIHKDLYNYDLIDYILGGITVKIVCKTHGIFEQTPNNHLRGQGCAKCSNRISNKSTKWLESLNITDMILEYQLPEYWRKHVDGYSPSTNTVYQFHGDYWHGNQFKYNSEDINPTSKISYGTLYEKTIESDLWILSLGYNLITMWESEFNIMVNHIS